MLVIRSRGFQGSALLALEPSLLREWGKPGTAVLTLQLRKHREGLNSHTTTYLNQLVVTVFTSVLGSLDLPWSLQEGSLFVLCKGCSPDFQPGLCTCNVCKIYHPESISVSQTHDIFFLYSLHLFMLKQRVRCAFKSGDTVGAEAQSFT